MNDVAKKEELSLFLQMHSIIFNDKECKLLTIKDIS